MNIKQGIGSTILLILVCIISFSAIFAIYLLFGPVFLVNSAKDALFYFKEANNTVQIKAIVTCIEEDTSADVGSEYDIYVSYKYHNTTYENIYWRTVGSKDEYSVNDVIKVNVFNSSPNDILDLGFTNYIGWIFPLFITIGGPFAIIKTCFPNFKIFKKPKTKIQN